MVDERIETSEPESSPESNTQATRRQPFKRRWSIADLLVLTFFVALAFGMSFQLLQATIVVMVFVSTSCVILLLTIYPMNRRRKLMSVEQFLNRCLYDASRYALLALGLCLISLLLKLVFPSTANSWEYDLRYLFRQ